MSTHREPRPPPHPRAQPLGGRLRAAGARLARGEGGQSLIFAAVTLFVLAVMALMVVGLSQSTSAQMRMQMAADSAAYSGAQVQADCIANIAWMNEASAMIYYHGMRLAVDTATFAVMAEMEDLYDAFDDGADPPKTDALGFAGANGPGGLYETAYLESDTWMPRAETWLGRIDRLAHGVALLGHSLVEYQARFTASRNGADRAALYPHDMIFWAPGATGEPSRIEVQLQRIPNADGLYDWHAWGVEPPNWDFLAEHRLQDAVTPTWHIHLDHNGEETDIQEWEHERDNGDWGYTFRIDPPDGPLESFRIHVEEATGTAYIFRGGETVPQVTIAYIDAEPGGTRRREDGTSWDGTSWIELTVRGENTYLIRYDDNGDLEKWIDADDDYRVDENDTLVNYGGRDSTTIDGVEVPARQTMTISVGEGLTVHLTRPVTLYIRNRMHMTLRNPLRVVYHTPQGYLRMEDDQAWYHGLGTRNADGRWRAVHWHSRIQHRMSTDPADPNHWIYERVRLGSFLRPMDRRKLAAHGIMQWDDAYRAAAPAPTAEEDEYWTVPTDTGDADASSDDQRWASDAEGRWQRYPVWAQPPRANAPYGGWFDLEQARPTGSTDYSLTRRCWHCGERGVAGSLLDYKATGVTAGRVCVRPAGFWHEEFVDAGGRDARAQTYGDAGYQVTTYHIAGPPERFGVQIECPVCEGAREFVFPPTFEDGTPAHETPTRVRSTLADAGDRHNRLHLGTRDFFSLDLDGMEGPLELSPEFFRFPVAVAVHAPSPEVALLGQVGTTATADEESPWFNPVRPETDGHFAMAVARLFFPYPANQATGGTYSVTDRFPWPDDLSTLETDALGRLENPVRQTWLESAHNLFEPGWNAALVPVSEGVDLRDHYTDGELVRETDEWGRTVFRYIHDIPQEEGDPVRAEDNTTTYLLRMLAAAPWRKSAVHSGYGMREELDRRTGSNWGVWSAWREIDWSDPEIENVVQH